MKTYTLVAAHLGAPNLGAPLGPPSGVLRPRFGSFPLLLLLLCLGWILLMRAALPRFGKRATGVALGLVALLLLSWLPRVVAHRTATELLTETYYKWVILPSTVIQVCVLISLASAPIWVLLGLLARRSKKAPKEPLQAEASQDPQAESLVLAEQSNPAPAVIAPGRREVLGMLAWAGPVSSLLASTYGVAVGAQRIQVKRVQVKIPGLPESLRGLRIGQLTDIHVSHDLTPLSHLEEGCTLLEKEHLDLVCCTGDLCDNKYYYPEVLRLIAQIPARLGHFACLGNHEYYLERPFSESLAWVRACHQNSPVRLLENQTVRLGELNLTGITYPHAPTKRFVRYDETAAPALLREALSTAGDGTTILLCHHPHVVRKLTGTQVDLMLAGHTHGGQLGWGERSLLELTYGFVRGLYQLSQGQRLVQLFVGSGLGHWLPWRINCPPEVVVIELG